MVYDFDEQKAIGNAGEQFLDRWFAAEYDIRPTTRHEQQRGMDRVFSHRQTGRRLADEYKTDYLVYCVPDDGLIYILALQTLRWKLPRWIRQYSLRSAQNEGYATHGVLVPLAEFERYAEAVISV